MAYKNNPELLRQELSSSHFNHSLIIIDEIQKVPELLNEVHWLIENKNLVFGLCGSRAKKLKQGHVNLLGLKELKKESLFVWTSSSCS